MFYILQDGNTPLHQAASHGYINIVEYLYRKGANINAVNKVKFIICIIMSVFIVLIFIRSRIIPLFYLL